MIYYQDLDTETEIWVVYQLFSLKMTSDAKSFVDLDEFIQKSYNFSKRSYPYCAFETTTQKATVPAQGLL
jgi:hypothetical protein